MNDFEKYQQVYGDLYEKELLLESEAKQEAENHLKEALDKAKQDGEGGEGFLAGKLMRHSWSTCRKNIHALV